MNLRGAPRRPGGRGRPAGRAARASRSTTTSIEIGAALTLTEIERRLDGRRAAARGGVPAVRLPADPQRRDASAATSAPASPIGDAPPALLALEATVAPGLGADGEREVPLADYFTGYRQTVRRPDELIRAVRIPLPAGPADGVPQDRQAALRRHLQRRRRLRPRRRGRRRPAGPGSVSAASRRHRSARWRPRQALDGRPWTERDGSGGAPRSWPREGTPMDDHRASAAYRTAMLGRRLPKLYATHPARRR